MALSYNPFPLGKVTVASAGVPVRITNNFLSTSDVTDSLASKIEITALSGNTGNIYIGYSGMNTSTMAGVLKELLPGDSWGISDVGAPNVFKPHDIYIDSAEDGDSAICMFHTR